MIIVQVINYGVHKLIKFQDIVSIELREPIISFTEK